METTRRETVALFLCIGTRSTAWALVIGLAIVAGVLPAGGKMPVAVTRHNAWPGNREGLIFLWEDGRHTHQVGGQTCRAEARGQARIGPTSAMDLAAGAFVAENADGALLDACKQSNQLTVEAVITPGNVTQGGPARIVTFSTDALARNFTLGQERDTLIFRLRTPRTHTNGAQITLCKIRPGKTIHVVVSYRPDLLHCWVDGRKVLSTHAVKGDFSNWQPHHLLFGDEWNGHRDWAGQLSNVAVYSRFISQGEAARKYVLCTEQLKRRKPGKSGGTYPAEASPAERQALDNLVREIRGAVVYTRKGRVRKVVVGEWRPIDLGEGNYARWGPDGKRIAVLHKGAIYVMNADGTDRKKLVPGGVSGGDGCQMEFHTNGREILYSPHGKSTWSVNIADGKTRSLGLPFTTEFCISADGKRLVGRNHGCCAVELPGKKHRKYAGGCAPGISPDGQWLMNNTGSHKTMDIRRWDGSGKFSITAETCRPDQKWDNQHWSNHNDYIGIQSEGRYEAYVFRVSKNLGTRVSWEGSVRYTDLFVAGEETAKPARKPKDKQVAQLTPTKNSGTQADGGVAAEVRELTGSPTRLVWCQTAQGKTIRLCGLDTEDNAGERVILGGLSGWIKPVLTPDGARVVFSNRVTKKVCVLNWDGSELKELCRGFASEVWQDPATGVQWVYYRSGDGLPENPIVRCRLDNTAVKEPVWARSQTGHKAVPWFRLSADGKRAGDAFPWSKCGVADVAKGAWDQYGGGCWPSMAPDNSYRFFWFLGTHTEVGMFDAGKRNRRTIKVNGGPGVNGSKVYYPRWSNHVRFLTVIGPKFTTKAELLLGRFNSSFTAVDKWVRVTHNQCEDSFGDAWIKGGAQIASAPVREPVKPIPAKDLKKYKNWPGNQEGLVFLWANSNATNQIIRPDGKAGRTCRVKARGNATFGRFYDLDLAHGAAVALDVNRALLDACKQSNQLTIEAVITPDNVTQGGPARVVTFSNDAGSRNFTLGQHGGRLMLRLRTPRTGRQGAPPETSLCKLQPGQTLHVLVTYTPGRLCCYVNGREVLTSHKVQGDFSNWEPQHLLFGDEWNGQRDWAGRLEGIAIYSRAVSAHEAAHKYGLYAERLEKRQPARHLVVEGTLREVTKTPAIKDLQEYARALVVYSYEPRKVLLGNISEEEIQVTHWAILDRKEVPSIGKRKIGEVYRLELESFHDHPQLESERRFNDCEGFDAPLFYDAGKRDVVLGRPPGSETATHIKVNCGGPSTGGGWEADANYLVPGHRGTPFKFSGGADLSKVARPAPRDVYPTVRNQPHRYSFRVPNGAYTVRIHFTDEYDAEAKIRSMDYTIERRKVLERFNIVAAAGGRNKAIIKEFEVSVSDDDGLQIACEQPRGGDVFEAAIEVIAKDR